MWAALVNLMALSICVYTPVTVGAFQRLEERDHIEDNGYACPPLTAGRSDILSDKIIPIRSSQ